MLIRKHIRRRFERAAATFEDSDFVHAATRDGLLSRLEPIRLDAKTIIDLGAATGGASRALTKRFKYADIISVDIAHNMLRKARGKTSWWSKNTFAQADATSLPFADESVDVVFSNLLLPWLADPTPAFFEIARVLRNGGMLAFATLGPDSLQALRRAWASVDNGVHVTPFPDMHDIGDALVKAGLRDPVLDVDHLSISYRSAERLLADLTATGARNVLQQRARGLTGRRRFAAMIAALEDSTVGDNIAIELELIFGHCWGAGPKMDASNYKIDAAHIPVRQR